MARSAASLKVERVPVAEEFISSTPSMELEGRMSEDKSKAPHDFTWKAQANDNEVPVNPLGICCRIAAIRWLHFWHSWALIQLLPFFLTIPTLRCFLKQFTGAECNYRYKALATIDVCLVQSYCVSLHNRFRSQTSLPEPCQAWMVRTPTSLSNSSGLQRSCCLPLSLRLRLHFESRSRICFITLCLTHLDSALGRSSGRTIREAAGSFPAPVLRTELAWVSG